MLTHKFVSIAKSIIRLLSCVAGAQVGGWFAVFCYGFAAAEVLGVIEELVDLRPELEQDALVFLPPRFDGTPESVKGMQCHCSIAQSVPHTIGEHESCFTTRMPAVPK